MKRYLAIGCIAVFVIAVVGCNKKDSAMEQSPENMSMDELGSMNMAPQASPEAKAVETAPAPAGAIIGKPLVKPAGSASASVAVQAQPYAPVAGPVNTGVEAVPAAAAVTQSVSSEAGKPNPMDIQTALKNAGFYNGKVDGKVGPMTIKAISEFQKANKLKADGKVGKKTWEALSRHLTAAPAQQ